ncbi:MAG: YibE/F family protein [Treponema sp.]|jgi:uncharacterized membrane protein|nr:YibE/F family protein [Treponema sp.]
MDEIKTQYPAISPLNLIKSGDSVSRHVTGAMSTTLLSCLFRRIHRHDHDLHRQGVPLENIINMSWVSSEVVHTMVGCFGLVLVAPLTVFAGRIILTGWMPLESQF